MPKQEIQERIEECRNTTSGKHIWNTYRSKYVYNPSTVSEYEIVIMTKCEACGIINDLKSDDT